MKNEDFGHEIINIVKDEDQSIFCLCTKCHCNLFQYNNEWYSIEIGNTWYKMMQCDEVIMKKALE